MFAAVAIASVTFTSCDGYLETFPSDSLVSTDAITTLQDVETALNGTYYSLKSASYYGCDFVSRAEVGGEDVQTISSGGLRTDTYYRFTHRQNNSPENLWSYPYAVINRANVLLNAIMIPLWGASGAALASLLTQISTILLFPALIKDLQPNVKLMIDAILLKDVF